MQSMNGEHLHQDLHNAETFEETAIFGDGDNPSAILSKLVAATKETISAKGYQYADTYIITRQKDSDGDHRATYGPFRCRASAWQLLDFHWGRRHQCLCQAS